MCKVVKGFEGGEHGVPAACRAVCCWGCQGVDGAKLELQEVVDFLKNPDKYTALGAKIPKVGQHAYPGSAVPHPTVLACCSRSWAVDMFLAVSAVCWQCSIASACV